jgi:small subunit ribosomal protein S21
LAKVVVDENESIESAIKRFRRKVQREAILKEVKKHAVYYKPGEKRRMKEAQARKRMRRRHRRRQVFLY